MSFTYRHNSQRDDVEEHEMDHIEQFRIVFLPVEDADGFAVVPCWDSDGIAPVEFGGAVQDAGDPHSKDNQLKE